MLQNLIRKLPSARLHLHALIGHHLIYLHLSSRFCFAIELKTHRSSALLTIDRNTISASNHFPMHFYLIVICSTHVSDNLPTC